MKVVIHDRTEQLPPKLRQYTEQKVDRLSRHYDRVLDVLVEFDLEQKRSQAPISLVQMTVHLDGHNGPVLRAEERATEFQAALDLVLDKMDRQLLKLKERIKERKAKVGAAGLLDSGPPPRALPERIQLHLRPESPDEARGALDSNGHTFHLFLNEETGDVNVAFKRADGSTAIIEPLVT